MRRNGTARRPPLPPRESGRILLGALAAALQSCGQSVDIGARTGDAAGSSVLHAVDAGSGQLADWQPGWSGSDFKQGFRHGLDCYDDLRTVGLVHRHLEPDGSWSTFWFDYTTSFDVDRVNSFKKNVLYVAGAARNGDTVVERWKVVMGMGIGGGPPDHSQPPSIQRTEIHRGSDLGTVAELGPDPQDRYVLVLHSAPSAPGSPFHPDPVPTLSKIALSTGNPVTHVLDASENADLSGALGMYAMQHVSDGRLWIVESQAVYPAIVLYDHDDDGELDSWASLPDEDAWQGLGYDGAVWTDDFVLDWYWH